MVFKKSTILAPLIFIVLFGLIPLTDLFHSGLPLTHDGQDHIARIANFYSSLSEGVAVPRWAANLNWGFGHPILMFLYPLPSYSASFFHLLGFSLIDSVKIVFGLAFIASGVGMFLWVRTIFGIYAGLFAAVLYMVAPYRFVNLYVRGAIGEHVAFAFIPFILFFLTKILIEKKTSVKSLYFYTAGLSLLTAGLVLSHNALSIIFFPFVGLYAWILFYKKKRFTKLLISGFSIFYGFFLSAFFWFPAFWEGKYTLRDIVTLGEYSNRFVDPVKFFSSEWSYGITGELSVQIGVVHLVLIILSLYVFIKRKDEKILDKRIYLSALLFFILSLFMMVKESDFIWRNISLLQKFQFPWRFLSLTVLTTSLLGAYASTIIKRKEKMIIALFILCLSIIFFYGSYFRAKDYLVKEDEFFKKVYYGTTDTGESGPIWSVRFMEKEAGAPIEVISGDAIVQEAFRSTTRHEYVVDAISATKIKENTLYFPGWNVYIDENKIPLGNVEYQNPQHRGLMTFDVDKGLHKIVLVFEDTKVRMLSNLISAISLVGLLLFSLFIFIPKKNNEKRRI